MSGDWLQDQSARIQELLDELGGLCPGPTLERIEELMSVIVGLYGAGLERALTALQTASCPQQALDELCDDELLTGLLVLHGIHPRTLEQRVERALDAVRPTLDGHGGGVDLIAVRDHRTLELRMLGAARDARRRAPRWKRSSTGRSPPPPRKSSGSSCAMTRTARRRPDE